MKRFIAIITAALCLCGMASAFAFETGDARTAVGANLDEAQLTQVYADFGVERGAVKELTVTNAEERAYLEGLVDDGKIGSVSLSCVYITILEPGSGLQVTTKNINWCSEQMYKNALTTAGITDAKVVVTAPFEVSGTAALTGIYKAYEDITGKTLSNLAKSLGAEELVLTGQLAEYIGSDDAAVLINELKGILDVTENMPDDEVLGEISKIAEQYNVQISDSQKEQVLGLCRKLEKLDVDELQKKLVSITESVQKASAAKDKVTEVVSTVSEKVQSFFGTVSSFFSNLFKK